MTGFGLPPFGYKVQVPPFRHCEPTRRAGSVQRGPCLSVRTLAWQPVSLVLGLVFLNRILTVETADGIRFCYFGLSLS